MTRRKHIQSNENKILMRIRFILDFMFTDEDYISNLNSMIPFYGHDWHVTRFCATTGLKTTILGYMVIRKCFTSLSYFVVVKDFELFWDTSHLLSVSLMLEFSFQNPFLSMMKANLNKALWETESFIYRFKGIKATF